MSNINAARLEPAMREDSLNTCLDRSIDALEKEIGALENIAGNLDGSRNPPKANESKVVRPDHTMFKAKHLEDLIGRVGELSQRINSNIAG